MSDRLTEDYLTWLSPQLSEINDGTRSPNREFWGLMHIMYEKEFPVEAADRVPNDYNRLADGLALRVAFCRDNGIPTSAKKDPVLRAFLHKDHPEPPCSFLEVVIALSQRLAFAAGGKSAPGWAYVLMSNLGIHRMADPISRRSARKADDILDRCIWRNYEPNGMGGFFPLAEAEEDQTQIEIWYQMPAYVAEVHRRR